MFVRKDWLNEWLEGGILPTQVQLSIGQDQLFIHLLSISGLEEMRISGLPEQLTN